MAYSKTIYEIFQEIATEVGVFFLYGSYKEIQKRLVEQSKDPAKRDLKYPLMCLITPIPETRGADQKYYSTVSVTLLLLAETRKEFTTEQRVTQIYKPTLYPLWDDVQEKLTNMEYFDTNAQARLEYDYLDLFHYSAGDAKDQNRFAAVLDAIEITNLTLNVLPQNCI